jgi:hypothetical protein
MANPPDRSRRRCASPGAFVEPSPFGSRDRPTAARRHGPEPRGVGHPRHAMGGGIALALLAMSVPPVLAWLIESAVGLVAPRAVPIAHASLCGGFIGVLALEIAKHQTSWSLALLLAAGVIAAPSARCWWRDGRACGCSCGTSRLRRLPFPSSSSPRHPQRAHSPGIRRRHQTSLAPPGRREWCSSSSTNCRPCPCSTARGGLIATLPQPRGPGRSQHLVPKRHHGRRVHPGASRPSSPGATPPTSTPSPSSTITRRTSSRCSTGPRRSTGTKPSPDFALGRMPSRRPRL